MNKFNLEELTNYLEELEDIQASIYKYNQEVTYEKVEQLIKNLLQKHSILELLIIKYTSNSIVVKFDIEEEIKRRIEDARKNND